MVFMPDVEGSVPLLEEGMSSERRKPVCDWKMEDGEIVTSRALVPFASNFRVG